ncbi:hypothetical protein D3C85_1823590 [compost metagenome]
MFHLSQHNIAGILVIPTVGSTNAEMLLKRRQLHRLLELEHLDTSCTVALESFALYG